ncbi:hypothetical protein GCM10023189_14090 [Nibrella saemangeumensis]|uniref:Redox-active disulfide protein 2 n=1 Tax=Nibrella saemangeumensis TaxID=1084526 RepID=A0ABP8MN30_9BACT
MKKDSLKEKSTEELLKLQKTALVATSAFAGVLAMLFVMIVYLTAKDKFTPLVAVPFGLLPILALNVVSLKKIRQELNARKTSL